MDVLTKRELEKALVGEMIRLYCRGKHGGNTHRCPQCAALAAYAEQRSDHCPLMASKTFCSNCAVHCYKPDMRTQIQAVMRWSGPRMIFRHPVAALRHLVQTKREKFRLEATH